MAIPLLNKKKQKGLVLIVTLLVLLVMILASAGLMRSMDTSLHALGNITFKQSSNAAISQALETAIRNLPTAALNGTNGFYGFIQANEDANGIPAALQTQTNTGVFVSPQDAAGNTARIVVERMCNAANVCLTPAGALRRANENDSPNLTGELYVLSLGAVGAVPRFYYRVTVRVDGPKNTVSYGQAMIIL